MATTVSRRTALRVIGGAAAAAGGVFAGLFPEGQILHAEAAGGYGEIAQGRQLVLRQRTGEATRNARAAQALARPGGGIARRFLATQGFGGKIESIESADVLWTDEELVGTIDALLFYDARKGKYAYLIRQSSKTHEVIGAILWSAAQPETCDVYDVLDGRIVLSATLTKSPDGTITVRAPDGRTDVVRPRSAQQARVPGLAAPSMYCTQVCTWECTFICNWVCKSVLVATCIWSTICGPLVFICAGACIVTVIAVCEWSCGNYCSQSCRLWCDVIQESAA
jgi:hypothetical protein